MIRWLNLNPNKIKNLRLPFFSLSFFLSIHFSLLSQGIEAQQSSFSLQEEQPPSTQPLQEVATLGGPTAGSLIEGVVGSMKGCRHRFYCHSAGPTLGFLGFQTTTKPLMIKNQPGIFPAPLMGPASLTFNFNYKNSSASLTPVVVRPDGRVFQGLPMTMTNSPQTLVISSPAQTGIYTVFVLAHQKDSQGGKVTVNAAISTQPQHDRTFLLKSFDLNHEDSDLMSAEFIYAPSS